MVIESSIPAVSGRVYGYRREAFKTVPNMIFKIKSIKDIINLPGDFGTVYREVETGQCENKANLMFCFDDGFSEWNLEAV